MIHVIKDFIDIPSILKKSNREIAFNKNILDGSFSHGKKLYKVKSVQKILKDIYNLKCAYCEKKLLDASKHIEHYRPKSTYYWLAYSWDNLLLSCGECNTNKGVKFDIENRKRLYNNEPFNTIHNLGNIYDEHEKPRIINPEKEDILDKVIFDKNGEISSRDDRILYTINDVVNLNREELVDKRIFVLNNFISKLELHYDNYTLENRIAISRFYPDINQFVSDVNEKNTFYSFRFYILNNLDEFIQNNELLFIVKNYIALSHSNDIN